VMMQNTWLILVLFDANSVTDLFETAQMVGVI